MNTITKEQMAALLNGRKYGDEMTRAEHEVAKRSGLVVVFGYSDDCIEVRGAWGEDEFGAYNGGMWKVGPNGVRKDWDEIDHDDEEESETYFSLKSTAFATLKAIWSPKELNCSWVYELNAPHVTFDIMEDGELYCRGIVFAVVDLPTKEVES